MSGDTQTLTHRHAAKVETLLELGRYQEAVRESALAIAADPEDPINFFNLSRAHLALDDPQGAQQAAESAIRLDPEMPAGFYMLSFALHAQHNFTGELKAAEAAARLNPEAAALLDRLARAQLQSGMTRQAQQTALKLVELDPEDADTHSLIADISLEIDDFDRAETHLFEALRQRPDDAVLINDLGRLHMGRKHWKQAREAFHRALKTDPGNPTYLKNLEVAAGLSTSKSIFASRKHAEADSDLPEDLQRHFEHQGRGTWQDRLRRALPIVVGIAVLAAFVLLFKFLE